jgi:hypothetical protein
MHDDMVKVKVTESIFHPESFYKVRKVNVIHEWSRRPMLFFDVMYIHDHPSLFQSGRNMSQLRKEVMISCPFPILTDLILLNECQDVFM